LIGNRPLFASTPLAVAEQTLSNAFDFAHKVIRVKEPQELAQIQSAFVGRQDQVLGEQTKELGHRMMEEQRRQRKERAESPRRSEAA